jgi:small subunit ribosomal protein S16
VSVKIRLKRFGSKKRPYYRIVVMNSRSQREGKTIDEVGFYHPVEIEEKQVLIEETKVKEWLDKGATPTDTVKRLLNRMNFHL